MFKTAGLLPSNHLEWGNNIIAELADRLPDIESYISDYRTITQDGEGSGLGLISLQGSRAFIPVIIKRWKSEPMDLIMYKTDNQIKFKYLSRRSLVDLLILSGLGQSSGMNTRGSYDASINIFSPIAEYHYSGNPYYGMQYSSLSKAGSLYLVDLLDNSGLTKYASNQTKKLYQHERKEPATKFAALGKIGDTYEYYAPGKYEDGILLTHEETSGILSQLPADERMKAAATLQKGDVLLTGGHYPRPGNVLMQVSDKETQDMDRKMPVPTEEGVFITSEGELYINPRTVFLDQEKCEYSLGVGSGFFTLRKEFPELTHGHNSPLMRSREELIPEVKHLEKGKFYAIFDDRSQQVTVPFKLLTIDRTDGQLVITGSQVFGDSSPITIHFYSGSNNEQVKPDYMLYSSLYSRIVDIPDEYKPNLDYSSNQSDLLNSADLTQVAFFNNGGSYTCVENGGNVRGPNTETKTIFDLINRYKFSQEQAKQLIKSSKKLQRINFYVKNIYGGSGVAAVLNKEEVPMQEKAALEGIVKMATELDRFIQIHNRQKAAELKEKTATLQIALNEILTKQAAAVEVNNPAQTDAGQRSQDQESQMNAYQKPSTLLQGLMNVSPVEKNTRDIIDKLMFYYGGMLRVEDSVALLTAIDSSLREVENYLGNCLLLVQLGQMPGQSYDEVRTLLADVDSFLANLSGSKIMLRNV